MYCVFRLQIYGLPAGSLSVFCMAVQAHSVECGKKMRKKKTVPSP